MFFSGSGLARGSVKREGSSGSSRWLLHAHDDSSSIPETASNGPVGVPLFHLAAAPGYRNFILGVMRLLEMAQHERGQGAGGGRHA